MSHFVPRKVFPKLDSLPRSYYLGHHAAGLSKMRTMLSQIDLVLECRDARIPLTSRNPLFEESLVGTERIVVYTKKDLTSGTDDQKTQHLLSTFNRPARVMFCNHRDPHDVSRLLKQIRSSYNQNSSLTGSHLMIVGMPNVGKSSLLNALRHKGVNKGKVAKTGAQPGVTRKIGTSVKILEDSDDDGGPGVYLLDTPGVFMPYVPDADAMLKLALCGSVKDSVIPPFTIADYLLFRLNRVDPTLYQDYCAPTNNVMQVLTSMAQKTGRLQKGGEPDLEGIALWMIQRWRNGHLGQFMLDPVDEEGLRQYEVNNLAEHGGMSLSQARKADKAALRDRARMKKGRVSD